jgi:phosphoglycolate phosphatase
MPHTRRRGASGLLHGQQMKRTMTRAFLDVHARYHPAMLILFDIDGTMLHTQKAGVKAMGDAGRELFGDHFSYQGVEFSGRLDPLIWRDLAEKNGVEDHAAHHDRFRASYAKHLVRRLASTESAIAMPGVMELLMRLSPLVRERVTLGLLTGNYPDTGEVKLRAAGFDPDLFAVRAWGIDGATRRDLPTVALGRYAELKGAELPYESVTIIGDTPHDVDCARAHGCRALGVATGAFSVVELIECGADLALGDLSETDAVLGWLMDGSCVAK